MSSELTDPSDGLMDISLDEGVEKHEQELYQVVH